MKRFIKFTSLSLVTGVLVLLGSFYIPRGASKAETEFNCPAGTFLIINVQSVRPGLDDTPDCMPAVQTAQTPTTPTTTPVDTSEPPQPVSNTTGCQ